MASWRKIKVRKISILWIMVGAESCVPVASIIITHVGWFTGNRYCWDLLFNVNLISVFFMLLFQSCLVTLNFKRGISFFSCDVIQSFKLPWTLRGATLLMFKMETEHDSDDELLKWQLWRCLGKLNLTFRSEGNKHKARQSNESSN